MRRKILIVEDDADILGLLCFNFRKAGYWIGTAVNGIEALKKARSLSPDLIVLDLMLPDLDGFAVCETLRRHSATVSTPIVMLTALSTELGRMAGLDCGATVYLTKPFSPRLLISQVGQLLAQ